MIVCTCRGGVVRLSAQLSFVRFCVAPSANDGIKRLTSAHNVHVQHSRRHLPVAHGCCKEQKQLFSSLGRRRFAHDACYERSRDVYRRFLFGQCLETAHTRTHEHKLLMTVERPLAPCYCFDKRIQFRITA